MYVLARRNRGDLGDFSLPTLEQMRQISSEFYLILSLQPSHFYGCPTGLGAKRFVGRFLRFQFNSECDRTGQDYSFSITHDGLERDMMMFCYNKNPLLSSSRQKISTESL